MGRHHVHSHSRLPQALTARQQLRSSNVHLSFTQHDRRDAVSLTQATIFWLPILIQCAHNLF